MCEKRLTAEEVNRYKRAFAIFDVSGDGAITTEVTLIKYPLDQNVKI